MDTQNWLSGFFSQVERQIEFVNLMKLRKAAEVAGDDGEVTRVKALITAHIDQGKADVLVELRDAKGEALRVGDRDECERLDKLIAFVAGE